jgi:hypothetical protein
MLKKVTTQADEYSEAIAKTAAQYHRTTEEISALQYAARRLRVDAGDLTTLFAAGGEQIRAFAARAQDLGLILNSSTVAGAQRYNDALGDMGDSWDALKARSKAALSGIAETAATAWGHVTKWAGQAIEAAGKFFGVATGDKIRNAPPFQFSGPDFTDPAGLARIFQAAISSGEAPNLQEKILRELEGQTEIMRQGGAKPAGGLAE